jgi:multicomponent K+:H+ antiporter subunit D
MFPTEHWLVVPIVLPLLAAAVLLWVERIRPAWQAPLAVVATMMLAVLAFRLVAVADTDRIAVYLLGNWQAPFGIVLVLDRLAAMMLALTAVIALASLAAGLRLAGHGPHFHAFFQLQLAGLNGAFLTGDVFNLFVFFEVLLIASYALLFHNAGGRTLRTGLHYVVINLIGASLFLIAASLFYGFAGKVIFCVV